MMNAAAAIDCLNQAFRDDPGAMHALIVNRVPCNEALADHPTIEVGLSPVAGQWEVGTLGVVNGILRSLGLPAVAVMFSDEAGVHTITGFCEYKPSEAPHAP